MSLLQYAHQSYSRQTISNLYWMTYRAAITAAAPRSILAQAKMLLIKQSVMKTTWAIRPACISALLTIASGQSYRI